MNTSSSLYQKGASATIYLAASSIIKLAFGLLTTTILARIIDPEEFGIFSLALVLSGIFELNTKAQVPNYYISSHGPTSKLFSQSLSADIFLGLISLTLTIASTILILPRIGQQHLQGLVVILGLQALTIPYSQTIRAYFEKENRFRLSFQATLLGSICQLLIATILGLVGCQAYALTGGILANSIMQGLFFLTKLTKIPNIGFDFHPQPLLKYCLPLLASSLLVYFYWNIDDFMVGSILGNSALGLYYIAFRAPHYILSIKTSVARSIFSLFAMIHKKSGTKTLTNMLTVIIRISSYFFLFLLLISIFFGRTLISAIFGRKWLPIYLPLIIFMIEIFLRGSLGFISEFIKVTGKNKYLLWSSFIPSIIIPTLGPYLTRAYHINGMAFTVMISVFLLLTFQYWLSRKFISPVKIAITMLKPTALFLSFILLGLLLRQKKPEFLTNTQLNLFSHFIFFTFYLTAFTILEWKYIRLLLGPVICRTHFSK